MRERKLATPSFLPPQDREKAFKTLTKDQIAEYFQEHLASLIEKKAKELEDLKRQLQESPESNT